MRVIPAPVPIVRAVLEPVSPRDWEVPAITLRALLFAGDTHLHELGHQRKRFIPGISARRSSWCVATCDLWRLSSRDTLTEPRHHRGAAARLHFALVGCGLCLSTCGCGRCSSTCTLNNAYSEAPVLTRLSQPPDAILLCDATEIHIIPKPPPSILSSTQLHVVGNGDPPAPMVLRMTVDASLETLWLGLHPDHCSR